MHLLMNATGVPKCRRRDVIEKDRDNKYFSMEPIRLELRDFSMFTF
jgi:hypothetical protein